MQGGLELLFLVLQMSATMCHQTVPPVSCCDPYDALQHSACWKSIKPYSMLLRRTSQGSANTSDQRLLNGSLLPQSSCRSPCTLLDNLSCCCLTPTPALQQCQSLPSSLSSLAASLRAHVLMSVLGLALRPTYSMTAAAVMVKILHCVLASAHENAQAIGHLIASCCAHKFAHQRTQSLPGGLPGLPLASLAWRRRGLAKQDTLRLLLAGAPPALLGVMAL